MSAVLSHTSMTENIILPPQWLVFWWVYTRLKIPLGAQFIYTGKNVSFRIKKKKNWRQLRCLNHGDEKLSLIPSPSDQPWHQLLHTRKRIQQANQHGDRQWKMTEVAPTDTPSTPFQPWLPEQWHFRIVPTVSCIYSSASSLPSSFPVLNNLRVGRDKFTVKWFKKKKSLVQNEQCGVLRFLN